MHGGTESVLIFFIRFYKMDGGEVNSMFRAIRETKNSVPYSWQGLLSFIVAVSARGLEMTVVQRPPFISIHYARTHTLDKRGHAGSKEEKKDGCTFVQEMEMASLC